MNGRESVVCGSLHSHNRLVSIEPEHRACRVDDLASLLLVDEVTYASCDALVLNYWTLICCILINHDPCYYDPHTLYDVCTALLDVSYLSIDWLIDWLIDWRIHDLKRAVIECTSLRTYQSVVDVSIIAELARIINACITPTMSWNIVRQHYCCFSCMLAKMMSSSKPSCQGAAHDSEKRLYSLKLSICAFVWLSPNCGQKAIF